MENKCLFYNEEKLWKKKTAEEKNIVESTNTV